jgi:hypothetical protein
MLIIPTRDVARGNIMHTSSPVRIRSRVMIQYGGVPSLLSSEEDMRVLIKLVISKRTEFEASQTILDEEGNNVSFRVTDTLRTANDTRFIVDRKAKMFKLSG